MHQFNQVDESNKENIVSKNKHERGGSAVAEHAEKNAEQVEVLASEVGQVDENLAVATHPAIEHDSTVAEVSIDDGKLEELKKTLSPENLAVVETLQAEIAALSKPKKVASGSKARPNVVYTLLNKPPKWSDTPQVAQIEQILFSQPKKKMTEPEIFELIKAGAEAGVLRTRQNPVRIFQYYRANLISENVLIYQ